MNGIKENDRDAFHAQQRREVCYTPEKKRYTVRYTETYTGYFDVEASTADEVVDEFLYLVQEGKFDLLDMEMTDSKVEIEM